MGPLFRRHIACLLIWAIDDLQAAVQSRIAQEAGEDPAAAAANALGVPQSTPSPVLPPTTARRSHHTHLAFGGSAKLTVSCVVRLL